LIERKNMIAYVYQTKRRRNGKLVAGRMYRARVRFPGEHKTKDIPLLVTEKRSAEQKLQKILTDHSMASVGLIPPEKIQEAAAKQLKIHFGVYLKELATAGCVKRYVQAVENYVNTLLKECRWEYFKDVSAESFELWRQQQKKAPKTLNEYMVAMRAFLKWAERLGYVGHNALAKVATIRVRGRQKRARRAYTPEEIQNLLNVAGPRQPIYLLAALTGIRRGEIKKLRWADFKLDDENPTVTVSAAISKNHYEDPLPLHPDLVTALKPLKLADCKPEKLVFKGMFPGYIRFYADLKAAGIQWQDQGDGPLDFHSLRVTYCTQLAPGTPSERVRMALLRHRDPNQTAKTYTDTRMLPLKQAIEKLTFHQARDSKRDDTQRDTQTLVKTGQNGSSGVTLVLQGEVGQDPQIPTVNKRFFTQNQCAAEKEEWSERQDSNLRLRGPKPRALARLSYAPMPAIIP